MSVAMALENEKFCPLCGRNTLRSIELHDKEYADRCNIHMLAADQISEDGIFLLDVCTHCGFKYAPNLGKASTSQVFSILLAYYIDKIYRASVPELASLEEDFCGISGKKYVATSDHLHQKLRLIYNMTNFFRECSVDDLLEAYNNLAANSIEELHSPTVAGESIAIPVEGPLTARELLNDD